MNTNSLRNLARVTRDHLRKATFPDSGDGQLAESFASDLEHVLGGSLPKQMPGEKEVRALRYAPIMLGRDIPEEFVALTEASRNAFGQVRWTEFYEEDDWSKPFLSSFANGEGIGPDGRLFHKKIILGLFILGSDTTYPTHAHPAEEFYIVLAGNPEFQVGSNNNFERQQLGSIVLHHSEVSHCIRTTAEPFFAIFGWRGDIEARSWYRDDMADSTDQKKYPTIRKK
jgi:hypothetical protein